MKNGFTLIELLAVITVLGLLGLIVVPVVDKLIKDSEDELYQTQIKNIESAAKNWASENIFSLPENVGEYIDKSICDLEKNGFLDIDVKNPKTNELFYKDSYVRIIKTDYGYEYTYNETGSSLVCTICEGATEETKTSGNIPTGNYTPGDEYICEVKEDTKYHFFILSTEEDKINLIMNTNIDHLGNSINNQNHFTLKNGKYIPEEDYTAWNEEGEITKGPITAMKFLYDATKNWTNVSDMSINHEDVGKNYNRIKTINGVTEIIAKDNTTVSIGKKEKPLKTRLPLKSELENNGCEITDCKSLSNPGKCPIWLTDYLSESEFHNHENIIDYLEDYWTLDSSASTYVYSGGYNGDLGACLTSEQIAQRGVRPVITVSKDLIKN